MSMSPESQYNQDWIEFLKSEYKVGDMLEDESGKRIIVLHSFAYVMFVTEPLQYTIGVRVTTQKDLEDQGFKLYTGTPEPTKTKYTMQEIADKIGMGVDSFEIVE